MSTVRLRWTGPVARTFMRFGVGEVQPGRSFPVPAEAAASFLAHENVVPADPQVAPGEAVDTAADAGAPGDTPAPAKSPRKPRTSTQASPTETDPPA